MALLGGLYWGKRSVRWISEVLVLGSLAFISASAVADTLSFAYDAAGRIQQAHTATVTAQYRYDTNGNLTKATAPAASAVAISGFTPFNGNAGSQVVLNGTGFSTTLTSNTVKFNGVAATVVSATATALTVTVPATATSGLISVTVAGQTASSLDSFTVTSSAVNATPTVTAVSSNLAVSGSSVTLTGNNFLGSGANLWVRVNGQLATITSVSATQLVFTVPAGASSGSIVVGDQNGVFATSTTLYVPPSAIPATSIGTSAVLVINGTPLSTTIPANQQGIYAFTPQAQPSLGLSVAGLASGSLTITAINPNGSVLTTCTITNPGNNCHLTGLQAQQTYSLLVNPASSISTAFTISLSSDATGSLPANGTQLTFNNASRVGQYGRYAFNAVEGLNYSINWSGSTFTSTFFSVTAISVYAPDGTLVKTTTIDDAIHSSGSLDLRNMTYSGIYTVLVDSPNLTTGQVSLVLSTQGSLVVDGPTINASIANNQNGYFTFVGTVGQRLGLGINNVTTNPSGGNVTISLLRLDGTLFNNSIYNCTTTSSSGSCNIPILPATGVYTIEVSAANGLPASVSLTLSTDLTGTLTPGAAAKPFTNSRAGQNGRYTFSAVAGQNLNLVISGNSFPNYAGLTVYKPDGTSLTYTNISGLSGAQLALSNLPMTGTYTVFIEPNPNGIGVDIGTLNMQLNSDATNPLVVNGGALSASLQVGQGGNYTFSGLAGQHLSLGFNALTTNPANGTISASVIGPDNVTSLVSCGYSETSDGASCLIPALPQDGTYTVRMRANSNYTASVTLTLSSDLTDTLTPGAAAKTFNKTRVGQNGRYTFNATAGQNLNLLVSASTLSKYTYFYVYNPDGSTLTYTSTYNTTSTQLALNNLPVTGTYTVFVYPTATDVGTLNLQLNSDVINPLTVNGGVLSANLAVGQNGDYTFTGVTGQKLGLGISALTTNPVGGYVTVSVMNPDHTTTLVSCGSYSDSTHGGNCNLPALPVDGSYTIHAVNSGNGSASMTMALWSDLTGTLTTGAAPIAFSTNHIGQNGRYTFNAVGGQNLNLVASGSTFPNAGTIYIYNPDNTLLTSANFYNASNNTVTMTNLPMTGTYTALIDPSGVDVGSVNLQLVSAGVTNPASEVVNGNTNVDGTTTTLSITSSATVNYTFSGVTGQKLGLGISALTTNPSGGYVSVSIITPDNVTALNTNCSTYYAPGGGSCNLSALPRDGTYTIRVMNGGAYTANMTLTLSNDVTGTLTPGAVATTFTTARIGQNGRYTFSGVGGQNLNLVASGSTFPNYANFNIYKPDGNPLIQTNVYNTGSAQVALNNLPMTGTYTAFFDPNGMDVGTVKLQLNSNATNPLVINGGALSATLAVGQNGDYTFAGATGQQLGLGISALTTNPTGGSVTVSIVAPDNVTTSTTNCTSYFASSGGGSCNIPALPFDGTYTVHVVNNGANTASMTLTLSSDLTGTLTAGATAKTVTTTRIGQNARYTFSGVGGQNLSLLVSGSTYPSNINVYVYQPDQTTFTQYIVAVNGSGQLVLNNLPVTGTYTAFVDPSGTDTGSINLKLNGDSTSSLTVNGSVLSASLAAGQNGSYTFTGITGQQLGLGISALSSTPPAGASISVTVIDPDNHSQLMSCGAYYSVNSGYTVNSGGICMLPPLPADGVYTIKVAGSGAYASSFNLTLSTTIQYSLTVNDASQTFSSTRVGQLASYTFTKVPGGNYTVNWSGANMSGTFNIYRPDGTFFGAANYTSTPSSGVTPLYGLDMDGVYTIVVQPAGVTTGQITLSIVGDKVSTASTTTSNAGSDSGDVPLPTWAILLMAGLMLLAVTKITNSSTRNKTSNKIGVVQ